MIEIEGPDTARETAGETAKAELATVASGGISRKSDAAAPLSVGALERALLARFPREHAESWDRMGLLVGDPAQLVEGVAVALDATADAVRAAKRAGANVLLTHHPAFLDPPAVIGPRYETAPASGVTAFEAVRAGVALVNFHTALDVSDDARALYLRLLGVDFDRVLLPGAAPGRGYGMLCTVREVDRPFKLSHLAGRCTSVFGSAPRVWGDFGQKVESIVIANGSAGDVVDACLGARADCLVCGEVRYHAALDASQVGLAILELGHDVSELPLCAVLAQAARDAGVPATCVFSVDQGAAWRYPESTRI